MLTASKFKIVQELIAGSSKEELIWLNGYLAGILAQSPDQTKDPDPVGPGKHKITIAYGTETGNSKKLAADFATKAKKKGIHAKLVSLDQYRLPDLSKEEYFLTIISTQGEGEPPAAAKKFYDHIHQNGFRLSNLKYAILALGDTGYPLYCKAGEDVDAQLYKLGAERIHSLQKCDTDYETEAGNWFNEVMQKLNGERTATTSPAVVVTKRSSAKKIYSGKVLTSINLNDRGSRKHTQHIELAAEELDYQPGDSIGVVPENPRTTIDAILDIAGLDPQKKLSYRDEEITLFNLLKKKLNIIYLPERVIKKYGALVKQDIPDTKMGLLDLLKIYPVKDAAQFEEALSMLEPITPRLYSISSSLEAHAGEVHITVAKDIFKVNDEIKYGLCSETLTQLSEQDGLDFYIHRNSRFRLPLPETDIIMIGPGTGIAPFRSFLEERDATGATGRNWLFFGDQHFCTDFLYQTEIQNWLQTTLLTKIEVAFSRDQGEKIYVQHKMLKQGAELFDWLEAGAHLYVCGAKEPMSVDVEHCLLEIIKQFGNKKETEAIAYLDNLLETGRYVKDVY
jgi:sulfite reductase (NADPH) flavoprotein alpha-component